MKVAEYEYTNDTKGPGRASRPSVSLGDAIEYWSSHKLRTKTERLLAGSPLRPFYQYTPIGSESHR
jgi:hypothetical protein